MQSPYYIMKRSFRAITLAAAFAICSCSGFKTDVYSEEMSQPAAVGTDSLYVSISLEYPFASSARDSLILSAVLSAAFDLEEDPTNLEETVSRYESALSDQFLLEGEGFSWEDRINGYFSGERKGVVSYMIEYYSFRGGAHGISTMTPIVFDKKTGAVIPEPEFFAEGYEAPLGEALSELLPEVISAEEYDAVFERDLLPNGCYEVGREGVTWYYQPYEIGAYSIGVVSLTLPWSLLKPYLRN